MPMNKSIAAWLVRAVGATLLILAGVTIIHSEEFDHWFGDLAWRLDPFTPETIAVVLMVSLSIRLAVIGFGFWWRVAVAFAVSLLLFVLANNLPAITGDHSPWDGEAVGWAIFLFAFPISVWSMLLACVPLFDTKFRHAEPANGL
jgi:hypothetical protein